MPGEKIEELADVAAIGFQGLVRHAPLGAEKPQPAADFGGNVGGDFRLWHHGACYGDSRCRYYIASFTLP